MQCETIVADETDILPRLGRIDVLVTMALTAEMRRAATGLELVQVPAAGLDRIDFSALPHGAMLANAYGDETGIAEYVIGAILALIQEFTRLDRRCAREIGRASGRSALRRLRFGRNWPPRPSGYSGYGRIGQSIAPRARGSDTEVCAIRCDVRQSAGDDLTLFGIPNIIDEMRRRSDYVVISMPVTPETIDWIGRSKLRLIKPNAFLINIAQADIADDDRAFPAGVKVCSMPALSSSPRTSGRSRARRYR
jgi:phosphoglycerate dehydrogenase-like enzyme